MIRLLITLPFLIPMAAQDLIERKASLTISIPLLLISVAFSFMYDMQDIAIISSILLLILFFIVGERQTRVGGADILTLISFFFIFTVPITAMIIILSVGISFIYIAKTKNNNVPFIVPLTLAAIFVDLFNSI